MYTATLLLACLGAAAHAARSQGSADEGRQGWHGQNNALWQLLSAFNHAAAGCRGDWHCDDGAAKQRTHRARVTGVPKLQDEIDEMYGMFEEAYQWEMKPPEQKLQRLVGPRLRAHFALMEGLMESDAETLRGLIQASRDIGWTEERDPNLKWAEERLATLEGRSLDEVQEVRKVQEKTTAEVVQDLAQKDMMAQFQAAAKQKLEEEQKASVTSGGGAEEADEET
mmetsp:Transcript_25233/g.46593  ORF Transcript_25233/g.46593 Transcript_25233/m.46593 type:complete len:225 (-) Transcript_25233:106-780(-)